MAGSRFRRMANHARSPLTEQTRTGRSSKAKSFTTRRRTEVGGQKSEVSHRRQSQRLIDSRPRSSTLAGLPVDVSRLPPVPLSIFISSGRKSFEPRLQTAHGRGVGQGRALL